MVGGGGGGNLNYSQAYLWHFESGSSQSQVSNFYLPVFSTFNQSEASIIYFPSACPRAFKMAAEKLSMVCEDIKNEKSPEISNIFASEFNKEEMHDRVLCFQVIDDAEVRRKGYSGDSNESVCESPSTGPVRQRGEGEGIFLSFLK